MQFDSLSDFIQMNGHGVYVWAVYFLGLGVLLLNVLRPKMMMKRFYKEQYSAYTLQAAVSNEKSKDGSGDH